MPDILMQVLHENDYFILMLRKEVDTHMIFRSYSLEFPRIIGILNGRKCICVQIRWYMPEKIRTFMRIKRSMAHMRSHYPQMRKVRGLSTSHSSISNQEYLIT